MIRKKRAIIFPSRSLGTRINNDFAVIPAYAGISYSFKTEIPDSAGMRRTFYNKLMRFTMSKFLIVMIIFTNFTLNLFANDVATKFLKAYSDKKIIQYKTDIYMDNFTNKILNFNCKSSFMIEPSDSIIGAYFNFIADETAYIYNGAEYFELYPSEYGNKIVKYVQKSKQPEEFIERKIELCGRTLLIPSPIKATFYYDLSIVELKNDIVDLEKNRTAINLSDTMINGYNCSRIRYTVTDTIVNGERYVSFYLIAYDKITNFPVYLMKNSTNQNSIAFYSDFNFESKGKAIFLRRIFSLKIINLLKNHRL
ncbi:MAG: hypothetical protein NT007_18945 [Candidatus Kapabacteria bacterium]|nr:hypothetical protein [Candidatus Kapabacteria bacterium]